MKPRQLSIWTNEEMEVFAPRNKTKSAILREKRELLKEQREIFGKKLLERITLSEEEITKYNAPLYKKKLVDFFNKNSWEIGKNYYMNKGVPQMMLTSLSKYSNKEPKDLLLSDLVVMYKSFNSIFSEKLRTGDFRMFKKANNLNSFGISQYEFMDKYLQEIF